VALAADRGRREGELIAAKRAPGLGDSPRALVPSPQGLQALSARGRLNKGLPPAFPYCLDHLDLPPLARRRKSLFLVPICWFGGQRLAIGVEQARRVGGRAGAPARRASGPAHDGHGRRAPSTIPSADTPP